VQTFGVNLEVTVQR